jgi:hypothetical protein
MQTDASTTAWRSRLIPSVPQVLLPGRARVNLSIRRERRLAHRLSVPLLTTPATAFRINDASSAAAAAWVFLHGQLLFLDVITSAAKLGDVHQRPLGRQTFQG